MKKNNSRKELLRKVSPIIIGLIFGFLIIIFTNFFETQTSSFSLLNPLITFSIFMLTILIQLILHEFGHLIFGLLTGYEFVSFRIGSLTIIKENGKFILKKFTVQGTAGQCLLSPKSNNYKTTSYILYNLGGILINAIVAILSLLLYKSISPNKYINTFLISISITGLYFFITNGIPIKMAGIANDGYNLISILKSDFIKYCFYMELKTVGLLHKGVRMKNMPLEWFTVNDNSDFSNPLITSIKIFEANYYHDKLEFNKARQCYEFLINYNPKIIKLYENEINCDLLFYEIIAENREEKIKELYTKKLKSYINATDCYITRKRLNYAYALIVEKNLKKANNIINEIETIKKTYPTKAELDSELEIIDFIKSTFSPLTTCVE